MAQLYPLGWLMRMQFWQLQSPDYDDYHDAYINGDLTYPFRLPPVRCAMCGKGRSNERVLPFRLPEAFHKRKEIWKGWPISRKDFDHLRTEIERELRSSGVEPPELQSGDSFQPGFLDVPSKPQADFLWSRIGSPVVSERVRSLFLSQEVKGVEFWPVSLRKIGNREAKSPPPIPTSGEPEDMFDSVSLLRKTDKLGPYYHMVVHGRSDYPPGGKPLGVCPDCGWKRQPPAPAVKFVMLDSMWNGHDVFFLGDTAFLMVTDRIKLGLQKIRVTNVEYRSRAEELRVTPFASAIREARCCYCGGQPCVGADPSLKRFMCNPCSSEYYRYVQEETNRIPSTSAEGEQVMQTILDAADAHMKIWPLKGS